MNVVPFEAVRHAAVACLSALIVLTCLAPDAWALPSGVVDLAAATTASDLHRVHGSVGSGSFGVPIAGGFDCDDDGFKDYALAAMVADPSGRTNAGEVFLVFGDGTVTGTLDTGDPNDPRILHVWGDGDSENTGSEIWMDDVTGDDVGDLLIARQNFTPDAGRTGAGALTIVVGGSALRTHAATLQPLDLRSPPAGITVLTIVGAQEFGRLGIWVRTGDITGDTIPDIVVGADQETDLTETHRGAAYVVRGGAHLAVTQTIDLADFGTTALVGNLARITPPTGSTEYHFGATVQIGDLDKNGRGEVLVAAALNRAGATLRADGAGSGTAHGTGGSSDGSLYIAWDDNFAAGPWVAGFTFDVSVPTNATIIHGGARNRSFGEEMLAGLDYDDDGEPDLFVGDIVGDGTIAQNRFSSGTGHVIYDAGTTKGLEFDLDTTPLGLVLVTFLGPSPGDIAADTAMHGDFDGDAIDDLAFSSPHGSPLSRAEAGIVHVIHGRTGPWPALIDLMPGAFPDPNTVDITEVYGAHGTVGFDTGDVLCYSGAAADIDSDGKLDIITNEMLGNGITPAAEDTGNLVIIGGARIANAPSPSAPPGPPQTKAQQRCLNEMNKRGAAVGVTQGSTNSCCIRNAARGLTSKLGTPPQTQTAQACLTNDVRNKVARKVLKLEQRETSKCLAAPSQLPAFGFTSAAGVSAAATSAIIGLVEDLYGADLTAAVVSTDDHRDGARCQFEGWRGVRRVHDTLWKQAVTAKKGGLRGKGRLTGGDPSAPVRDATELQEEILAVLAADPRDRVQRAVDTLHDRALSRCTPALTQTTLAALFPGACAGAGDVSAWADCVEIKARCQFCTALNAFDALAIDCDVFDDATTNLSCSP